jgi:hypothetical protein
MSYYCPVPKCDQRPYGSLEAVRTHLKKAQAEGDPNHIDIADLEGWDETSDGKVVKLATDLEPS